MQSILFFVIVCFSALRYPKTGTHCAGTIGAIGGNNEGVDSVNPDPEKIDFFIGKGLTDSGSGSTSGVLAAVNACVDSGANVISMSLGGGGFSQASFDTYNDAYDAGVLIIAAAGNGVSHQLHCWWLPDICILRTLLVLHVLLYILYTGIHYFLTTHSNITSIISIDIHVISILICRGTPHTATPLPTLRS
jgi:hypothetical protein